MKFIGQDFPDVPLRGSEYTLETPKFEEEIKRPTTY